MTKRKIELTTASESAGQRLDQFLAPDPRIGSRSAAQRLIDRGCVTVDGRPGDKAQKLMGGERITVDLTPTTSDAEIGPTADYAVALEDEHLLVVDKPSGVVVHPAPGHKLGTLSQALAARGAAGGEHWRPGIVHRLDKGTSGLMVVAKSDQVLRALQDQLARREMGRIYLALVRGHPASHAGTVDAPLGRERGDRKRMGVGASGARQAVTHFETVEELQRDTLLRLRLETGRTHQIRVHLAAIGLPVCGDPDYGSGGDYGLDRQFLHAAELSFTHPVTGAPVKITAPLPADLEAALQLARGA
jgi:23S rRNA pseudouridine1911/1915/1917 synthase